MSDSPESLDLQVIWDTYKDFESFTRGTDGDINCFVNEWKEKMTKVQSAGCQYSDVLLGLKLMEKVNLSHDSIAFVISKLNSCSSSPESFLAQVVTEVKEQVFFCGFTENQRKEKDLMSFPIMCLEEDLSKPHQELHPNQGKNSEAKKESKSQTGFLKCPICYKNFLLMDNLKQHTKIHNNTSFGLDEDSADDPTWIDSLEIDAENVKEDFIMKDKIKNEIIKSEVSQDSDFKNGHIPKATDNYSRKSSSKNHHNGQSLLIRLKKFPCEICGRSFSKNNLKNHMKVHTRQAYKCSICSKEYMKLCALKVHMETHKETRDHVCSHCDKSYKTKYGLNEHIANKHDKAKSRATEPLNNFRQVFGELISSEVIPDGKKPSGILTKFPCEICGRTFRKKNLKNHMETHKRTKESNQCIICQKQLKDSCRLRIHMETHNTTKDYICSYCGKKYKTKGTLTEHLNMHTKAKPLPCKFCEKVFFNHGSRKFHIRAHHTGEKPYKCDFCEKRFYISTKKVQHMRYHTGEKPFPCHLCGRYFRETGTLKRHIRNIHKEVKPNDV